MKFSVVTPSFNQGAFIEGCISSVQAQRSDVDVEFLLFDNCSTDETAAILAKHKDMARDGATSLLVERDHGQTHAINKGFAIASGDVLCWLNTDERYKPGALSTVRKYFHEHPSVDIVFGDVEFVDASQRTLRYRREVGFSPGMLLYYGCFLPSCATFVRKTAALRAGPLDETLRVVMDFEWYLRLERSGARFAHIPAVLASFTWHDSNISSTLVDRRKAERRAVQDRYSRLKGPALLKGPAYWLLKQWWIGIRVFRRALRRAWRA